MDEEKDKAVCGEPSPKKKDSEGKKSVDNGNAVVIYGMAFIGALVYFIQHASSFWAGVLGFFKAIFWPAVLIYKALELLKM